MLWFKHDADANADAKLMKLRIRYGLEAYGLYWYMLELIAGNISSDNITFELEHDADIIAFNTQRSAEWVQQVTTYMIELGLFEVSSNRITCLKMLKRLDSSMTSNKNMRNMITEAKSRHDTVMIKSGTIMQEENRTEEKRIDITTPAKPKHNDDDMTCANYILGLVKQNNPTLKADVNKWAVTINQIVRLDKRTHRDICELFLLVSNDVREGFSWSKICRSPAKLRERKDGLQFFDIITDQLKNGGNNAKTGHRQSAAERAEASAERFTDYAKATDF